MRPFRPGRVTSYNTHESWWELTTYALVSMDGGDASEQTLHTRANLCAEQKGRRHEAGTLAEGTQCTHIGRCLRCSVRELTGWEHTTWLKADAITFLFYESQRLPATPRHATLSNSHVFDYHIIFSLLIDISWLYFGNLFSGKFNLVFVLNQLFVFFIL